MTITITYTRTSTPTPTFTGTQADSATYTPSVTATPTHTLTRTPSITRTASPTRTDSPTATISATVTQTSTISPTLQFTPSVTPTITATSSITQTHTVTPTITVSPTSTPEAYAHIEPATGTSGDLESFSYRVAAKGAGAITQIRIKIPAGVSVFSPASSRPGATVAIVSGEIRVVYASAWNAFTNPNFDIITFDAVSAGPGPKLFESYLNAITLAIAEVPSGYTQAVIFDAPTSTGTPTITNTVTPTSTRTPYVSPTYTVTRTSSPTYTVTLTHTDTPVYTATISPTITETYTGTPPTFTSTETETQTWTLTETESETSTETDTPTPTITVTYTATDLPTPTITNTITIKGIDVSYTDIADLYYAEGMPSAPLAVYRFTNIGGADEPVHGIKITALDGFNSIINGSLIFGNIYAVDASGNTLAVIPYPSGSVADIAFASDLIVPLQQVRGIYIYADIKNGSGPAVVKLSLGAETDVDADVPVSAAPGYSFGMNTKAVDIRRLTTVLEITGFDLMPPAVSTGQQDVYAYLITVSNPGSSQYSDSIITGITLTARNDQDVLINAGTAISGITLRDATTVFYSSVSALTSSSIYCKLSQPVTITAGASKNIYAVIDVTANTANHASGIKLSYESVQAFGAREYHYPSAVSILAAAGYSYPFLSSAALILNNAAQLIVSGTGTMPANVSTGQQDVQAMSLVLSNAGNTLTASVMSTLIGFYLKDGAGNVLNPAGFIDSIKVTSADSSVIYGSVSSFSGGKINVNLTAPVIISGSQPVTLSVKVDVSPAFNAVPFTVALNSNGDIYAVDSNKFTPVQVIGSFPVAGGLASMQDGAAGVNLSNFTSLAPASVVKGRQNMALFAFDVENPGGAQTADAEFTGMTVYLTDGLNAYISAGGALLNVSVIGPAGVTLSALASPSGSAMDFVFSSPVLIPQGSGRRVTVYADILPAASAPDFRAAILSGLDVWVRDYNSKIEAAKNPAPAMPWRTSAVSILTAPATDLSVWHDGSLAPVQVGAGQADVRYMSIALYNDAFPGSAPLRVSGVAITAIDSVGAPLALASVLDGVRIINLSGATVYSYAGVSMSASSDVYLQFATPVDVPAATTRTVYVSADISASPAFVAFRLRVLNAAAFSASNLPSGAITVSAGNSDVFPMDSNLTAITSLAYTLQAGHQDLAPVSAAIGEPAIRMLRIIYTNNNSLPISVTRVAIAVKDRSGALINADTAFTNIYMLDSSGATIMSQAATASPYAVFLPASFTVPVSGANEMIFAVDISPSIAGSFYLELAAPGDVSTAPPATLAPAPGDFFGNLRSGAPSIQPRNLAQSYHGFPNPFNPALQNMTIEYYLPAASVVTLKLYTIYGRFVRAIAEGSARSAGLQAADVWDGKNASDFPVKSGVYLCVLEVTDQVSGARTKLIRKVVLLR